MYRRAGGAVGAEGGSEGGSEGGGGDDRDDGDGRGAALVAVDLTTDQKPDSPGEMERILAMGGCISAATRNAPSRVWHKLRGLAMARSIGDHAAAKVGVIAEPVVDEYTVSNDDACLIVASDGVWELLTSDDVARVMETVEGLEPAAVCEAIMARASHEWRVLEGAYRDDITIVAVRMASLPWRA